MIRNITHESSNGLSSTNRPTTLLVMSAIRLIPPNVVYYLPVCSQREAKHHIYADPDPPRHRPSKHWMAAPMAVSSCKTFVDFLSRGSTVFEFLSCEHSGSHARLAKGRDGTQRDTVHRASS